MSEQLTTGEWQGDRDAGAAVAAGLLARDPALSVRQVHDPVRRADHTQENP